MEIDQFFEAFVKEAESFALEPDTVVRSLSGEIIDPNDDACSCSSAVRRQLLDLERVYEWLTGRKGGKRIDDAKRFIREYLVPRLLQGKAYHCLGYAYLMQRFNLTRTEVIELLRLLRNKQVIEIVYPASKTQARPAIYKVSDRFVERETRCGECGLFFAEVLEAAEERSRA